MERRIRSVGMAIGERAGLTCYLLVGFQCGEKGLTYVPSL